MPADGVVPLCAQTSAVKVVAIYWVPFRHLKQSHILAFLIIGTLSMDNHAVDMYTTKYHP